MNALGLPGSPRELLADLGDDLDAAYRELAARLGDDTPASVDEDGKLHVAALAALPDPPGLIDLRHRVTAMMPQADLPEMVLEMMSWLPEFAESFTHVASTSARVADLGVSVREFTKACRDPISAGPFRPGRRIRIRSIPARCRSIRRRATR
ncbi:hypothetical protein IRT45_30755 [Nocardia sp. BSTN01]|uniref:hypothetical protein n=1 Tax=Nocardia sp. BSTN01 TaxID=2783665 RepID=UPI00188EFEF2|nr:hypothetical protein [Nocardia sp. BSTN01]MBF5001515.1 hypothetical protein [Nocardia sp. BSTN01]